MDKDEQLWKEYDGLRDEIKGADSQNYQILGIVVGAVAAILTTGVSQVDPIIRFYVFLCAYVVTIPGYRLLQGNRRRIWQISTYMRVFLESQLEFINWETRLDMQRRLSKSESGRNFFSSLVSANEWFILSMMNSLTALAAIFGGLLQANTAIYIKMAGIVAIIIFNLWLLITTARQERNLRRLGKVEQVHMRSWLEIREQKHVKKAAH